MIEIGLGSLCGLGLILIMIAVAFPDTRVVNRGREPGRLVIELRTRMALAGMAMVPVPAFIAVSALISVVAAGTTYSLLGVLPLSIISGIAGVALPFVLIGWRARSQRKLHRGLWPDVLDHMVASIRSGASLPDSVSSLALSGPAPLRSAFAEFRRDFHTSASFAGALDRLKDTLGDPVADRIIETLKMARDVGGTELPGVLRTLSAAIREDSSVRSEVDARQSWVRNAAKLGVAAPWLILLVLSSRPEAAAAYNSPIGVAVIAVGAAVSVVAYRFMLALGRLPEERRWFR